MRQDIRNIIAEEDSISSSTNIIYNRIVGFMKWLRQEGYLHSPYVNNEELYCEFIKWIEKYE